MGHLVEEFFLGKPLSYLSIAHLGSLWRDAFAASVVIDGVPLYC